MEQEEGGELLKPKHVCKFCSKSFPCGRSLGGHMRSHITHNNNGSAEAEVKKIESVVINGGSSKAGEYDLRENPKKTWRFADSSRTSQEEEEEEETSQPLVVVTSTTEEDKNKFCRECGKAFHSWKALFGHMKCHSEKASMNKQDSGAHKVVTDSQSDNEGTGNNNSNRRRRSKRRRTRFVTSASTSSLSFVNHTSSSVSEAEQEQEEVAMSLIMLSRDVGNWGGLDSLVESSDNYSAYFEARSYVAKDSANLKSKGKKPVSLATVSINGLVKKQSTLMEDSEDEQVNGTELDSLIKKRVLDSEVKKGKFKCTTCNKIFHSYQALGGHRSSHKKMKGCTVLRNDQSSENSIETDLNNGCCVNFENEEEIVTEEPNNKKNKVHECPICLKIFSSGQALGGHKRSHFSAAAEGSSSLVNEKPVHEIRDFLDLNLPPASAEEEEISNSRLMENNYPAWWAVQGHHHHHQPKQEPLVGLISN